MKQRRGFTLLEVMVTLTIVGIISGVALLTFPSQSSSLGERVLEQARRLAAVAEQQAQDALLLGVQRGLRFGRDGYQILEYQAASKAWAALREAHYRLPEPVVLRRLRVEGRDVTLDNNSEAVPHVMLLSSGESSEFLAVFGMTAADRERVAVSGDLLGRFTIAPAAPQ